MGATGAEARRVESSDLSALHSVASEVASPQGKVISPPALARDGDFKQRQRFFFITETQFAIQSQVIYNNQTARNVYTWIQQYCDLLRQSYLQVSRRLRTSATLIWRRRSLDGSCQTGNMAALLKSLFFLFKISFLLNYRVIYYDYIVKW